MRSVWVISFYLIRVFFFQYFDLEIYTTSRQEKALEQLLKLIQETVEKHSEAEVRDKIVGKRLFLV